MLGEMNTYAVAIDLDWLTLIETKVFCSVAAYSS